MVVPLGKEISQRIKFRMVLHLNLSATIGILIIKQVKVSAESLAYMEEISYLCKWISVRHTN